MSRWLKWILVVAALFAVFAIIAMVRVENSLPCANENGEVGDFHQYTAQQLERHVSDRVPLGSSRLSVEDFLSREGMKYNYDPSQNAIVANASCLKGSGIVINSLGFTFRFDRNSRLKSIDPQKYFTGP